MRPGRSASLLVASALAGAATVVAAGLVALLGDGLTLELSGPLWGLVLAFGVLLWIVLVVPSLVRRAAERTRAATTAELTAAAAADHRRFLLRLDHELKNPLTAMRAGLANLADALAGAPADAPERLAVQSVTSQTVRLAGLVGDLRKLAELETRPLERTQVDIAEVLTEVEAALRELPAAAQRRISLSLPLAPWPLPVIPGDRDLLFLAVHNLATNAVKFSRPGDAVELRATDEGNHVLIEVADTGSGMAADEQGQVWHELARGRAARGVPGSGLGLAMVRTVVARHGGTVGLHSRDGHGTSVRVRLPVA